MLGVRVKAWRVHQLGEPQDVLRLEDVPDPEPDAGQLLVRVAAAAVNFPDVLMCRGQYQVRPSPPFTPGLELCGMVVGLSPTTTSHRVGDRVIGFATLPAGGFAELAAMDGDLALPAPAVLDDAQAASFHMAYQTGWFGLHRRARLQPGETLLVHAAAGGVGSAAVQLGKAADARVIGVVGGSAKVEVARELGADVVIDRQTEDVIAAVKDVTDGHGADVVYDPVGGLAYEQSTKCIAFEGRIVLVGFASGQIRSAALNHPLVKNYSIVGLHWGLYRERDPQAVRRCHAELSRLAADGVISPLVRDRLTLAETPQAMARLAAGSTVGRPVIVP
jgi:NADPH:quinone reductase